MVTFSTFVAHGISILPFYANNLDLASLLIVRTALQNREIDIKTQDFREITCCHKVSCTWQALLLSIYQRRSRWTDILTVISNNCYVCSAQGSRASLSYFVLCGIASLSSLKWRAAVNPRARIIPLSWPPRSSLLGALAEPVRFAHRYGTGLPLRVHMDLGVLRDLPCV